MASPLDAQAPKPNIDDMRLFIQVAQLGSISQAGKQLGISQSSVSKRLQRLEASLDQLLLDRSAKKVQLTEFGEGFVQQASSLIEEYEATIDYALQYNTEPVGVLTVAAQSSAFIDIGGEFFRRFVRQYPGLQLKLMDIGFAAQPQDIAADVFLLGQLGLARKMCSIELYEYRLEHYATADLLAMYDDVQHPTDLASLPYVNLRHPFFTDGTCLWCDEQGKEHSILIKNTMLVDSWSVGIEMALHGVGFTICPEILLRRLDPTHKLKKVFDGRFGVDRKMYLQHTPYKVVPIKIRKFIEALQQEVRKDRRTH